MSTLYVVATPIGNMQDITLRAIRTLSDVSLIASEDTRTTRKLLSHYDIDTPCTSYHHHNRLAKLPAILRALDEGDVALVSDAGTPAVNDPGAELVAAAARAGHRVEPIPGASALTAALSVAGAPIDQFVYLGFLPRRSGHRRKLLQSLKAEPRPWLAFESPHRLTDALTDILNVLGDRDAVVCRELTKAYEETFRGPVTEAIERFAEPRGEFTLIVYAAQSPAQDASLRERARSILRREYDNARTRKDAITAASNLGLSKNELYDLWLDIQRSQSHSDESPNPKDSPTPES